LPTSEALDGFVANASRHDGRPQCHPFHLSSGSPLHWDFPAKLADGGKEKGCLPTKLADGGKEKGRLQP
jgi:hypothetical protein